MPRVMGLAEALREWLDHRRDVLVRRSQATGSAQIEHRLEVLGGYLIAYLNLDEVIKIIRTEDEPKPVLMKAFKLTDVQADAILNMRLRNLRKLEEMEIRKEDKELRDERKKLKALLGSEKQQWKTIAERDQEGPRRCSGRRRARQAPHRRSRRRPSTTRPRSRRRWSSASRSPSWSRRRAGSARCAATSPICPASPSRPTTACKFAFHAETTSKCLVFATNGTLLHARCRQAAGRARPWRADPPVRRHRAGRRDRRRLSLSGRPQVPGRAARRAAASWCRRTSASATPARASRC